MLNLRAVQGFLSRLSKRERLVMYCAVIFVSITLLDRLLVYPISFKIKSLNEEINGGLVRQIFNLFQKLGHLFFI